MICSKDCWRATLKFCFCRALGSEIFSTHNQERTHTSPHNEFRCIIFSRPWEHRHVSIIFCRCQCHEISCHLASACLFILLTRWVSIPRFNPRNLLRRPLHVGSNTSIVLWSKYLPSFTDRWPHRRYNSNVDEVVSARNVHHGSLQGMPPDHFRCPKNDFEGHFGHQDRDVQSFCPAHLG